MKTLLSNYPIKSLTIVLIGFLIVCCFGGLSFGSSTQETISSDSSAFWLNLASNAWNYFKPGAGINPTTGLPQNGVGTTYFTDWDTGLYIQAIIDIEQLGLLNCNGTWGADDRINRVLTFLETRPLMADGLPYLAYNASTGKAIDKTEQVATDAGHLFVALKNLEAAKPALKPRIDNIVYDLTNYTRREISVDILLGQLQKGTRPLNSYDFYVAYGFAGYWPQRFTAEAEAMLNLTVTAPKINYQGVELPAVRTVSEPLLLSIYNLPQVDSRVTDFMKQAYLAQEARYNLAGKFTAFSEGPANGLFVWECISMDDGRMWVVQTGGSNDVDTDVQITPVVFLKTALGFLALYNTSYAREMASYLLERQPSVSLGYYTGIDENGNVVAASRDVGNALIISAAKYAVNNQVYVPLSVYPPPTGIPSMVPANPNPTLSSPQSTKPSPSPSNTPNPSATSVNPTQVEPTNNLNQTPNPVHAQNAVYAASASAVVGLLVIVSVWYLRKVKLSVF